MPLNIPSWKDPKAKKVYMLAGAAAAGFVAYRWWQSRSTPVTSVDSTMDTGSVTDAAGGGTAEGNVQYGGANIGSDVPLTNADWTNRAVQLLVDQGWDGKTVQVALGKYLNRQDLTDAEVEIVQAAIAVAGFPPVGTYTILHDISGGGGTGDGTGDTGDGGDTGGDTGDTGGGSSPPPIPPPECVDRSVRIVTERGVLSYDEVKVGDVTFGLVDGKQVRTLITKVRMFEHDDEPRVCIKFRGDNFRFVCTPEHRVLVTGGAYVSAELIQSDVIPTPEGPAPIYRMGKYESDLVWCPTTEAGNFLAVSEDGREFYTGNKPV